MTGRKVKYHPMADFSKPSIVKEEYRKADHRVYCQMISDFLQFLDITEVTGKLSTYEIFVDLDGQAVRFRLSDHVDRHYRVTITHEDYFCGLLIPTISKALDSLLK